MKNLTNIVAGHHSDDYGIMTLDEIKIKYEAEDAIIKDPAILININNLYRKNIVREKLYEATRKSWKVNIKRVTKANLACAVYRGIIREVYIIENWLPSEKLLGRCEFNGYVANDSIRNMYINKSVSSYWKQGSQNPIKYVNI